MDAKTQIVLQITDRFTGQKRIAADENEARLAVENGDFVTVNEVIKTASFTGQEVTTILSTSIPNRGTK